MNGDYSLPRRKARICRLAGTAFLLCAAVIGVNGLLVVPFPGYRLHCGEAGCAWTSRPSTLLDEDAMTKVQASTGAERAFTAYAERPLIRAGIGGVTVIDSGPLILMLVGVGVALRRLGGGGRDALARALTWLRLASQAALLWAIARPLSDSLMGSLLSAGTPDGAQWQIAVDMVDIGTAVMLGVAAFSTVWALEAGLRAQRDLDDFV